jgi:hypothetical protein
MQWNPFAPESIKESPQPAMLRVSASVGVVTHDTGKSTETLVAGDVANLPARGRITTAEGAEALIESKGLEVTLRERTEVGVSDESLRSVRVARGGVRCVVPPLGPYRQFSVVTPDATVIVHGTVFSVQFDRDTKQSCVAVEEGVVSVRHGTGKTWLEAGESWGCPPSDAAAADEIPTTNEPSAPRLQPGTLAAENALFRSAIAAERKGDDAQARAKLQKLLTKYPESPLAPEARATLARLKNKRDQ